MKIGLKFWVKNWMGIQKPPNVGKNNPYLCVKHVLTNVGQFSFFCENQLISVITWCYENLINCLTYIFVWANENWRRYKVLNFAKLTQFLDGAILTCTIIINFHNLVIKIFNLSYISKMTKNKWKFVSWNNFFNADLKLHNFTLH